MPDWYALFRAAERLHCPPWELEARDDGEEWQERALLALRAESAAQRAINEESAKKANQKGTRRR